MFTKTKKAQVVLAAIDKRRQDFEFLLLRTNKRRGKFWQNVTGKIEREENFEDGGLREAVEETQLNIEMILDIINLNIPIHFTDQWKRNVHEECFLIILDKKWKVKIDPKEHCDFRWVKRKNIKPSDVKFSTHYKVLKKSSLFLKYWEGR